MIVSRRSEALTAPDRQPGSQGALRLSAPADAPPMPRLAGVHQRFVAVNGVRLHYAAAGRGDPLVLLHGWPQHWWAWREVMPALAGSYRVICPDIRGFGWSGGGSDYALEQLAADLVGLLDLLGIGRARLVGQGWGSDIAHHACLNWPNRFSHLVRVGGVTPWAGAPRLAVRSWHILALGLLGSSATRRLGVPEDALRRWRFQGRFSPAEIKTYLGPLRRPVSAGATRRLHRHVLLHELPRSLRRAGAAAPQTPALSIRGEEDPLAGGSSRRSPAGGAGTRLARCGHFVAEERPSELLDRLSGFLR